MAHIRIIDNDGSERTLEVLPDGTTLGRSRQCDVRLDSPKVSRQHIRIGRDGEHYYLKSLSSKARVKVNGERTQFHWLRDGDQIELPDKLIFFQEEETSELSEQMRRSIVEAEAAPQKPRFHPYALATPIFMVLAAFHWAFAAGGIILGILALHGIKRETPRFRGRFLAVMALCGAVIIGSGNAIITTGTLQRLLEPDPIKTRCRENLDRIWEALQLYAEENDGNYPDHLAELHPNYIPLTRNLRCPGAEGEQPGSGYVFAGGGVDQHSNEEILVADSTHHNHNRPGTLVLFADGRIKRLSAREFRNLRLQSEWLE